MRIVPVLSIGIAAAAVVGFSLPASQPTVSPVANTTVLAGNYHHHHHGDGDRHNHIDHNRVDHNNNDNGDRGLVVLHDLL